MDEEIKSLRTQNKQLKEKIREQYQVFQEERSKLKSRNQVLRTQLYQEQARNKAAIEQFSEKIRLLENKIASKQQYVQFPQYRRQPTNYTGKTSRFQELEERGRRLEREADEILLKCRSGDPALFLPPPDIYQMPTYNPRTDFNYDNQANAFSQNVKPVQKQTQIPKNSRNTRNSNDGNQASRVSYHSNLQDFDGIRRTSQNSNNPSSIYDDSMCDNDVSNDSMIVDPVNTRRKDNSVHRSNSEKSAPLQQKVEQPIKRSSSTPKQSNASQNPPPKETKKSDSNSEKTKSSDKKKVSLSEEASDALFGDFGSKPAEKKSKSSANSSKIQKEKPQPVEQKSISEDVFAENSIQQEKPAPSKEDVFAEDNSTDDGIDVFANDPLDGFMSSPAQKEESDIKANAPNVSPAESSKNRSDQKQSASKEQDNKSDVFDDGFDDNFGTSFDIDI